MKFIFLSDAFYDAYEQYSEILEKRSRPYVCLEVCIDGMRFAIPLRHHITHNHAFFTVGDAGLDYTKAIVIKNNRMIADEAPQIDQRTFNALKGKEAVIIRGMHKYYKLLQNALKYQNSPRYTRILEYSALKYFLC